MSLPYCIPRCIKLKVYPSKKDPSKRIINEVRVDGTEARCQIAQSLWDSEMKLQKGMGIEKFSVHTYFTPPQVDDTKGRTLERRTILVIEFVDSGRQYLFQTNDGIAQWCFNPTLGGVDYGHDSEGHDRNLDGFNPHRHSFFFDDLIPVTTRTFRCLAALLHIRRPESVCNKYLRWHDHYVINIYLKDPGKDLNTVCATYIICGFAELDDVFHNLCCAAVGENRTLAEIDSDGNFVPGHIWCYEDTLYKNYLVGECGWSKTHVVRLVPFPSEFEPRD